MKHPLFRAVSLVFALAMPAFCSPPVSGKAAAGSSPGTTPLEIQQGQSRPAADKPPEGLAASDWSGIRNAYEHHRHAFFANPDGTHQARNPGQQWLTKFDGRGFTVTPDGGGWEWGLELKSYGYPGHERSISGHGNLQVAAGRLECRRDQNLTEWFVNDSRGLEQGWTLMERPAGNPARGPLLLELAVCGDLLPNIDPDGKNVRFSSTGGAAVLNYSGLNARDARGRDLPARFVKHPGLPATIAVEVEDAGAKFPITVDPIAQQAYLKASNTEAGDLFGNSVAISDNTVVVGAPLEDSGATGVNGNQADNSGTDSGAAYVFVRDANGWSQQAYLKASNSGAGDYFGYSVAISGDTVVIGAYYEDSSATGVNGSPYNNLSANSGAAYVFVRSGTTWSQQAYLKASNTGAGDMFGFSVAVSGDTVVVGAWYEDSAATGVNGNQGSETAAEAGAAYVFVRSGTTWSQQAYLKASNTGGGDHFGRKVAVSGDTVVVGATEEDSNATGVGGIQSNNSATDSGAAYIFVRNGSTWSQQAYLKASNTEAGDMFGISVAVSGNTVVVAAYQEDSNATGVNGIQTDNSATDSGAAYVFVRSGTTWSQQAYLKASNTRAGDYFGRSVAVSGDIVVVGADREDGGASGINGNQADASAADAGAAYVFLRNGTGWSQLAYLKASNTGASDRFGCSVAVSGNTVVVGANDEDSGSTGTQGNQVDNSASNSGAAYVFTGLGVCSLSALGSNGSIAGTGDFQANTTATLTATAHPGYTFTGWTGDASGTDNPLSVLMDRDKKVGATFTRRPPTISNIADRVIDEDGNTGPLAFSVSDTITPAASLTVAGTSSNQGLVPDANIVFGGSGGSRTVSVTPSPDQSGTAVITVTLSNGETTASDTFVLTVRSVNDPPTISAVADVTINEETSTPPIPFTVGDVETPAGSLVVTCNSSNLALVPLANIVPGGNGANRTVTITPAANRYGTSTITLTVSDGSATASTGFVLTVSHVNHAPVFSGYSFTTPYQTAATVYLVKILAKASDADGDTLSMMAGLSSHGSSVQVGASTLTYTPPSGFSGTDTFPVTISDSHGGTANGTVTVTVQPSSTAGGAGTNPPVVTVLSGGRVGIAFQGIPGHTYLVQRSTDLANWLTLATLVAGTDGAISYTDESPPPGSAYYRLAKP